jgi:PPOX class probable F420-dependent enzyme
MADLPDEVRELVSGANHAHVATVMPDGSPHSVPVWVDLEGDRVAILTHPQSRKARNLKRDPRVAISITHRDNRNQMAQIRGRVTERMEGDPAWTIIDRMSHKYLGMPYPLRTDRVVFLIEPEHAWSLQF